jgi:imidazolonepropionase-like amidohydrolase
MQKLMQAGLDPMTVIVSATRTNAEMLGCHGELGTLEAGKLADIVIVDGNPLMDMSCLARMKTVIQGGRVYYPDQLLPMLPSVAFADPDTV